MNTTRHDWKDDLSPATRAAVDWLIEHNPDTPEGEFCQPGWALHTMIDTQYPGGFTGFAHDYRPLFNH